MEVYSERGSNNVVSWAVLFEWEDCFAKTWNTKVTSLKNGILEKLNRRIKRYFHIVFPKYVWKYQIHNIDKAGIMIVMDAEGYYMLPTIDTIPIYLDFSRDMVDTIIEATKELPAFFVASKDIYNEMKEKGCKNVYFIHQCVSDQYYDDEITDKDVDVIQIGRKNPILHEYMLKYCESHPDVEYVYQREDASLEYVSTTRGNIGRFPGREEFVGMMKRAKVSLVSTPKCDNSRNVFGGADLVTARFYESAIFRCHMIGRYTDNEETRELELNKICPHVESYEQFAGLIDVFINSEESEFDGYDEFIKNNLASERAKYIQKVIDENWKSMK